MALTKIILEDPMEILDTGTFIHHDIYKPVILQLTEEDGTKINARFVFIKEENMVNTDVKFSHYNADTFQLNITHNQIISNFGSLDPIRIGAFNGKELFFNFRIDLNNFEDTPLITYTWYVGKEDVI